MSTYVVKTNVSIPDIDECLTGEDNCDKTTQTCFNTYGNFICQNVTSKDTCPAGFKLNEVGLCVDINECLENKEICNSEEVCVNEMSGYRCVPKSQFDDTTTETATAKSSTATTTGTSILKPWDICGSGFAYNATISTCIGKDRNGQRRRFENFTFSDIDECSTTRHSCDSTQDCYNVIGSYRCICKSGFQLDPITNACLGGCFT